MSAILDWLKDFSLVFIPIFVVMDPLGILPFLVPFLATIQEDRRNRVVYQSVLTGLIIGILFLALGQGIFVVLGITVADFLIAGGIVMLVFALREILTSASEAPPAPSELTAVVPIGTPLLVGPATISMLLVLSGLYGLWMVILAFLANSLVTLIIFSQSHRITRFLGIGGLQAFAKVVYLLLAAIAVQLIRQGITDIIQQF